MKKGKLVYVEGYLKTRSWDTPEGVKKFRTEVVAQDMIMLEKRPKEEESLLLEFSVIRPWTNWHPIDRMIRKAF